MLLMQERLPGTSVCSRCPQLLNFFLNLPHLPASLSRCKDEPDKKSSQEGNRFHQLLEMRVHGSAERNQKEEQRQNQRTVPDPDIPQMIAAYLEFPAVVLCCRSGERICGSRIALPYVRAKAICGDQNPDDDEANSGLLKEILGG